MAHSKRSPKREINNNTGIPQEIRKSKINNQTSHLKELETEQQRPT